MYTPSAFEADEAQAVEMAEAVGFGSLVTEGTEGLVAAHLPFVVARGPLRILAHAARVNGQFKALEGVPALLIVLGPFAYVSPSLYPSKAADGRVVPTWNYEATHFSGRLQTFEEETRLRELVADLTRRHEDARPRPWSLSDAPEDYVQRMLRGVVGLELRVERVEGTRKLSQNRSPEDRAGVEAGLSASALDRERDLAAAMGR